jgi:hypothetical protein
MVAATLLAQACAARLAMGTSAHQRDFASTKIFPGGGILALTRRGPPQAAFSYVSVRKFLQPVKESSLLILTGVTNPQLNQCGDGSWCCSSVYNTSGNATCCQSGQGVKLLPTSASTSVFSSPAASTSSTLQTSVPSSPPATSSPTPSNFMNQGSSHNNLRVGLGEGLGLGIPLAAAVICLAIFVWKRRHMPPQQMVSLQEAYGSQQKNQSASWQAHHAEALPEAVDSPVRAELYTGP